MSKILCDIDMSGNEILNCKTIKELQKKVAELEERLTAQSKDSVNKNEKQPVLTIKKEGYLSCDSK